MKSSAPPLQANTSSNSTSAVGPASTAPSVQPLIATEQQAAEATQHARALIQAQAQAALVAQANAGSQSVERLLS
jgi:hypothetical protein